MITNYITSKQIAAFAVLTLVAPLHAGVINEVVVEKNRFFKQTDATTVQLLPATDLPFGFNVNITGADPAAVIALKPRPTITLPANSTFATKYGLTPALGINGDRDEWNFGYIGTNSFDNWGTMTTAELNAEFPKGNYIFNVEGKVINLSFPNNIFPIAPTLILSGGNWSKGTYRIRSNKTLTINSGTYGSYGANLNNFLFLAMDPAVEEQDSLFGHVQVAKNLAFGPPQSSSKFYIRKMPANTLAPGTYYIYAGYGVIGSISNALPGAMAFSSLLSETEVKVVVLPPL